MAKRAVLGIDIGGTKTLCILFDERFRILVETKFSTAPTQTQDQFSAKLVKATQSMAKRARAKRLELAGVGIGFAGQVDVENSTIKGAPNILCLENYPIGKVLKDAVQMPVLVGNDVRMGLYGEHQLGVAAGCTHVLGVFLGTGVGGAAIIHNQVYEGSSGMGGQVGSILTQALGGPEAMLSHGILDRIASKSAIAGDALGMAAKHWAPYLFKRAGTDLAKISWRVLADSIKHGDKSIKEMIQSRMKATGHALSSVVNFMNPNMVVLGGGLTEEMPRLVLSGIEEGLREYLVPEVAKPLRVAAAKLKNRAVAYGAAKMALDKFS